MTSPRRFPPPWTVEDIGAAFVVKDNAGQKLAYVYFGEELRSALGRPNCSAKMTRGGSWRTLQA